MSEPNTKTCMQEIKEWMIKKGLEVEKFERKKDEGPLTVEEILDDIVRQTLNRI